MSDHSSIEWTDATWNPIVGCSIVSPGCTNCYAMKQAARIQKMNPTGGNNPNYVNHYDGTTKVVNGNVVWTGKVDLASDKTIAAPMGWRQPRRVFVNSMGDLFHEDVPDEWIDRVFAVMALSRRQTFQILTKRASRMRDYASKWFERLARTDPWVDHPAGRARFNRLVDWTLLPSVLPNIWLGVSAEDQPRADERIPLLLETPAAVRFVSLEPLLGRINLGALRLGTERPWNALAGRRAEPGNEDISTPGLDWVIVGGESGPHARPMECRWALFLRDQCRAAGIPFFFKQWGEWIADDGYPGEKHRVGKKAAGRLLDGVEHNAMPVRA